MRKTMTNRLGAVALALAITGGLAACGDDEDADTTDTEETDTGSDTGEDTGEDTTDETTADDSADESGDDATDDATDESEDEMTEEEEG